jgi:thioredoxin 1
VAYVANYAAEAPERASVDAMSGAVLLEFGANWCGHCQGAQPAIAAALRAHPALPLLKIEDGPGRRLGRSFRVKLWPTLILMRNGQEVGRVVRPASMQEIAELLAG